jgi:eukaryotic-like serine/threonine-protein kinase
MKHTEPPTPGTLPTRAERPRRAAAPRSSDTNALPEGSILGKYRIQRLLGTGGMGSVYEAVHTEMGKTVALKVLREEAATEPQARARFLREAAASSRIQHPHVVNVIDYGAEGALPFIVMQLLRGEDLSGRLDRSPGGLEVTEAADILLAVCAGVFAAHQAGVIHRDIKPKNIFLARLSPDEISPKVLDFGISKMEDLLASVVLTDPGSLMGTTHYLTPEQVAGRPVDVRTDQHALGVVLYECLTGRRPYDGDSARAILRNIETGTFLPPSRLRGDLPPALEVIVLRAMAHAPAQRFPSSHALGAALLPFASSKRQVAWADYYGQPSGAPSLPAPPPVAPAPGSGPRAATPASPPAPRTPSPAPELQTRLIAPSDREGPSARTQASRRPLPASSPPTSAAVAERRPGAAPPPTRLHEKKARSAPRAAPAPATAATGSTARTRTAGWLLPVLASVLVVATAWRLISRLVDSPADPATAVATPAAATSAPTAVTATAAPTEPAPAPPPAAPPPTAPAPAAATAPGLMDMPAAAVRPAGTGGAAPGLADLPARGFERPGRKPSAGPAATTEPSSAPSPGPSSAPSVGAPATASATTPVAAAATEGRPIPPTDPKEVTVRITDAPPGLAAAIDGRPLALPLRLRAGSPPVKVMFRAPGYQPREVLVDPRGAPTIAIGLRPDRLQNPDPATPGKRPRPALPPRSPSAPGTSDRFPSPGPILDI